MRTRHPPSPSWSPQLQTMRSPPSRPCCTCSAVENPGNRRLSRSPQREQNFASQEALRRRTCKSYGRARRRLRPSNWPRIIRVRLHCLLLPPRSHRRLDRLKRPRCIEHRGNCIFWAFSQFGVVFFSNPIPPSIPASAPSFLPSRVGPISLPSAPPRFSSNRPGAALPPPTPTNRHGCSARHGAGAASGAGVPRAQPADRRRSRRRPPEGGPSSRRVQVSVRC